MNYLRERLVVIATTATSTVVTTTTTTINTTVLFDADIDTEITITTIVYYCLFPNHFL